MQLEYGLTRCREEYLEKLQESKARAKTALSIVTPTTPSTNQRATSETRTSMNATDPSSPRESESDGSETLDPYVTHEAERMGGGVPPLWKETKERLLVQSRRLPTEREE